MLIYSKKISGHYSKVIESTYVFSTCKDSGQDGIHSMIHFCFFSIEFRYAQCLDRIHLLLLLSHVVIVVNLCCVEGLMEDRCISNKHSR